MKIKKALKFKRILQFYFLNSLQYKNKISTKKIKTNFDLLIKKHIKNLRSYLNLIFEYHQTKKNILFIGLPQKLNLKINKLTNHLAIDDFKKISNKIKIKPFKKPDIIVIVLHKKKSNNLLINVKNTNKLFVLYEKKFFLFGLNFFLKKL